MTPIRDGMDALVRAASRLLELRAMGTVPSMIPSLASAITKAASRQTFYTIRYLVNRPMVEDAYRAYAYFRWVDDVVDAVASEGVDGDEVERRARARFLDRQKVLLDACLRGDDAPITDPHETMLIELVRHADRIDARLEAYLRHMMLVMDFDVGRRGRLVSQRELDEYTRWLAVAVTEAIDYFIGNGADSPHDETRYLAVSGAHIVHMLRDTDADVRAGYFNIPREVLEASSIGPADVRCDAYRAWVSDRVRLARTNLSLGHDYFGRVQSRRHRLAGIAYMARFEWLLETIEREEFRLRPAYPERRSLATAGRMARSVVLALVRPTRPISPPRRPLSRVQRGVPQSSVRSGRP